jgi:uncharacterized membrane protein HdeD (DUF308 family)
MTGIEVTTGRTRSSARGLLACCAGLLGITVGVGIGLPHLAKTGLTLASVVGLAALVAGLVLMVVGARPTRPRSSRNRDTES